MYILIIFMGLYICIVKKIVLCKNYIPNLFIFSPPPTARADEVMYIALLYSARIRKVTVILRHKYVVSVNYVRVWRYDTVTQIPNNPVFWWLVFIQCAITNPMQVYLAEQNTQKKIKRKPLSVPSLISYLRIFKLNNFSYP